MKKNRFSFANGLSPFLFCFGMFILAMSFSVVICCSTFYAFHSINPDGGLAKSAGSHDAGSIKNTYASVR